MCEHEGFCEKLKSRLYHHQDHICAQQSKLRFCSSRFFEGQDCIPHDYEFGLDRTMTCEKQGFCCMRKCDCSECIKHMCRFLRFSWIANTRRPQWSEGHRHFRQTKPLDVYRHWWSTMLLPLQDFSATVYGTAARIEIRPYCVTIGLTS